MKLWGILLVLSVLFLGCVDLSGGQQAETPTEEGTGQQQITFTIEEAETPPSETEETIEEEEEQQGRRGYTETPDAQLYIYFFDIGEGEDNAEAILLKKGDVDILFDGGSEKSTDALINLIHEKGVDDIEVLVSTLGKQEHYGGLESIAEEFHIDEFWWNSYTFDDQNYEQVVEKVKEKAVETREVKVGQSYVINGITLTILNPGEGSDRGFSVENDAIVTMVKDRGFSMLLTSDILYGGQVLVMNRKNGTEPFDLGVDVLQIPGHGFGQSTTYIALFLDKTNPTVGIITGGDADPFENRYSILERLNMSGVVYYETYRDGTIAIATDGTEFTVSVE